MPLFMQVWDSGADQPRPLHWGWWHRVVLSNALDDDGFDHDTYGWPDTYTFTQPHTYADPDDGEVFTLAPGDRLVTWV